MPSHPDIWPHSAFGAFRSPRVPEALWELLRGYERLLNHLVCPQKDRWKSRLIGDHVAAVRRQSIIDFKREVSGLAADALGDVERVVNDQKVVGDSGTEYRVNIVILNAVKIDPLAYIETIAEQTAVNGRLRAFYDIGLNDNHAAIPRVAIYDDRHDWRPGV
jgi:hypothetical protein